MALLALVVVAASSSSTPAPAATAAAHPSGFLQPSNNKAQNAEARAPAHPLCSHHCQRSQSTAAPLTASGGDGAGSAAGSSAEPTKTCRNCLQQYRASENGPTACRHHVGIYTGRLARIDDRDPSGAKDWFWSCCGEESKDGPGCVVTQHQSYDEPAGPWRSGFQ